MEERPPCLIVSASIISPKQRGAIGAWPVLALMQNVGFVANAVQTTSSLHSLVPLMSGLPASLGVLSTVIVLFYPLNEVRMSQSASDPRKRRALEAAGNTVDGTLGLVAWRRGLGETELKQEQNHELARSIQLGMMAHGPRITS